MPYSTLFDSAGLCDAHLKLIGKAIFWASLLEGRIVDYLIYHHAIEPSARDKWMKRKISDKLDMLDTAVSTLSVENAFKDSHSSALNRVRETFNIRNDLVHGVFGPAAEIAEGVVVPYVYRPSTAEFELGRTVIFGEHELFSLCEALGENYEALETHHLALRVIKNEVSRNWGGERVAALVRLAEEHPT
ncbi:MAG: hypothetical protein RIC52_03850 [Amphiplicatus sp.]